MTAQDESSGVSNKIQRSGIQRIPHRLDKKTIYSTTPQPFHNKQSPNRLVKKQTHYTKLAKIKRRPTNSTIVAIAINNCSQPPLLILLLEKSIHKQKSSHIGAAFN